MIGLLQRVLCADVKVATETVGSIGPGLVVLVGVERGDGIPQANKLLHRIINYRVFADEAGKMNRCLLETGGELLLISQFTLAADTDKGLRPGFSRAADPELGLKLYEHLVAGATRQVARVATGRYGADMQVSLVNDGPVTFNLRVKPDVCRD